VSLAQVARYCAKDPSSLCYSVNIPDSSAVSGSGDIYFQLQGPDTLQWMALGQGQQMRGSNMFVVYADPSSNNVTLSPRLGTGHRMPQYDGDAKLTLLGGSGISNGTMTANVRCSNCQSWEGGSMQLTSTGSNWIWAMKKGDALGSSSNSAPIMMHDDAGSFDLDLGTARGGNSSNPFLRDAATTSETQPGSGSTGSSSAPAGGESSSGRRRNSSIPKLIKAHGIIMGVAFAILFPLGVIVRSFTNTTIWVHAGVQVVAYLMAWAGAGIGIYFAKKIHLLDNYHSIIGLVVVSVVIFQPILGLLQHAHFKKTGTGSIWGTVHRYLGLALVLLGMINGGLGLKVAGNSRGGEIAYGVVAGVFGTVMLAGFVMSTVKRTRDASQIKEVKRQETNSSTAT
jgi:hypothetical protein